MLREEADSFPKDDDDLGCAEGTQLKINLSDNDLVWKKLYIYSKTFILKSL